MKRVPVEVITIDTDGKETRHNVFKTMKDAEIVAREIAVNRVALTGIQTKYHTKQYYHFEDDFKIMCRKLLDKITIQYTVDCGAYKAGEQTQIRREVASELLNNGKAIEVKQEVTT